MHTRFILIEPSHAGNVGAVARAMKVMGFADLVLVRPRWADVLQRPEAIERASGATDVLQQARVVATWDEAVQGIEHLCATAMTPRDFGPPTRAPRAHFAALAQLAALARPDAPAPLVPGAGDCEAVHSLDEPLDLSGGSSGSAMPGSRERGASAVDSGGDACAPAGAAPLRSVGLVFGSERYGMRNDDVYRCHVCLRIPTAPDYGSLNLAAAAQVLAYEWRQALGGFGADAVSAGDAEPAATDVPCRADAAAVAGALAHWEQALIAVGYLDLQAPKKLMPRLQQLLHRAELRDEEVHILRGMARAVLRAARGAQGGQAGQP